MSKLAYKVYYSIYLIRSKLKIISFKPFQVSCSSLLYILASGYLSILYI
nr:MAG TPA: hypothetical protein [Caudoviricetes sp.]